MPPKKKQEEIDLSTLPECLTTNIIIFVGGKKNRSHAIQTHIFSQLSSILSKITRSQIMDFAKQKGIYVDPNTLNQKQKKDPKFMETICTQLTPEVFAKAFKGFIENKNIKVRMDKKQAQQKQIKKLIDSKYDWFYLANQIIQTKQQYEALAEHDNNIKFVLNIFPKISWSNSPYPDGEIPQNLQEEQQQDEELKQFKQLKEKQKFVQQDFIHQKSIQQEIRKLREFRKQAKRQSKFRDTFIDQIQCQLDPYNQKQFNNEIVKIIIQRINKLSTQFNEYLQWKNGKTAKNIEINKANLTNEQKQLQQKEVQKNQLRIQAKGQSHLEILLNLVDDIYKNQSKQIQKEREDEEDIEIQSLIQGYDFSEPNNTNQRNQTKNNIEANVTNQNINFDVDQQVTTKIRKRVGASKFVYQNQIQYCGFGKRIESTIYENKSQSIKAHLNYPGVNRFLMPDIPTHSEPLRKLNQSFYTKYLPKNMNFQELLRRLSLKKFEQILKDFDEEKQFSTNINQRVYEQFHNQNSLMRELYRAMALDQGHFISKYNPQNDKLYVALYYKTNQKRAHKKMWESNWKVIPNYQNWLKYFKQNQNNLNNQDYYDIDYEKIGNINQKVNAFCVPDGGVIINKQSKIANFQNKLLYAIKNHHIFGINQQSNTFYSQNQNTRIYHYKTESSSQSETFQTLLILQNGTQIHLKQTGDVLISNCNRDKRLYTSEGYTVLYDKSIEGYKILHPTGGISTAKSYTNELGYGLKQNVLQYIPTLLRRSDQYQIVKRDDNTVIINQNFKTAQGVNTKKWIKFQDGTEYFLQNSQIKIQKQEFPFVQINKNSIKVIINQIQIIGRVSQKRQNKYEFDINYFDGNHLHINEDQIIVTQELSQIPYIISLNQKNFTTQFQNQKIQIFYGDQINCKYYKNNKQYSPLDEQFEQVQNEGLGYQDYIEPKLFIINSNNTGVELLTEKQLQFYFHNKKKLCQLNGKDNIINRAVEKDINSQNLKIQQLYEGEKVYIVSKINQQQQNKKHINPNHKINLDIYCPKKPKNVLNQLTTFTVRTLTKYKPLTEEDNKQLADIILKKINFQKQIQKDENQFGHKTKDALQELKQKQKDKIIMIQFRKKQFSQKNFQQLKQEAIRELRKQQKMHMTMIEQQEKQTIIRNKMMEKKKSFIQHYPYIDVQDKQQIEKVDLNSTPKECFTHYFQTFQGQKALTQMPQWVFRPKTAKQSKQLDPQIVSQMNNTMNKTKKQSDIQVKQKQERYDTVDVNLNPIREILIKPSVFTQRQIDQQREAFQQEKKAYKYHQRKRKDFNIYGNDRQDKIQVSSLMRTQPISEINQKYLITQAPVDKKIKISSMKNKLTSQASSVTQMRKQGPHNTLLKTIDKRNDYSTLLQKRTMMVHADLNDKLQRDILINPIQANFGYLKEGKLYQLKINIKNEDIIAQRLVVKKPRTVNAKVYMNQLGPIALGMTRKVTVQIKTNYLGKFQDQFQIVSKHQIYKIPITANILSQSQFDNDHVQLEKNVREIVQISGKKGGRSNMDLPPIN